MGLEAVAAAAPDVAPAPAPADAPVTAPADGAVPTPPVEAKPRDSERFAALTRKEQKLRAQAESVKSQQSQLKEKLARVEAWEATQKNAKADPFKALEMLGLNYDDVTGAFLNEGKATPDLQLKALRDELESFKKQQADAAEKSLTAQKAAAEAANAAALEQFRGEVKAFVKANAEKYELIAVFGQSDLVHQVIEEKYAQEQRVMAFDEAAKLVEDYLEGEVEKARATKKFQAKAQPQPQGDSQQSKSAPLRSLSNQLAAAPSAGQKPAEDPMERALRAYLNGGRL